MADEVAGNQGGAEDQAGSAWKGALPEDLRAEKSLDVFKGKDVNEVFPVIAKSYVESQKMIGGSIRIPREDAKPEEIEAFFNKLGRPEKADGYQYTLPYPEYIDWNKERLTDFANQAHKAGFTPKQVQTALDWYGKAYADEFQGRKRSFEEATTALKTKWGGAFDRNMALAKRARDLYGGEEAKKFFADDPLGNNPVLIEMLAKMASDLEEGDYLGGPGETVGMNSDEAKSKIAAVLADPKDLYHAKFAGQPGHNERVIEVQGWYDQAYRAV